MILDLSQIVDHSNYPDQTEHRVILRLAGEQEISPMFSVRMGLNFFYGWVKEDFKFQLMPNSIRFIVMLIMSL